MQGRASGWKIDRPWVTHEAEYNLTTCPRKVGRSRFHFLTILACESWRLLSFLYNAIIEVCRDEYLAPVGPHTLWHSHFRPAAMTMIVNEKPGYIRKNVQFVEDHSGRRVKHGFLADD